MLPSKYLPGWVNKLKALETLCISGLVFLSEEDGRVLSGMNLMSVELKDCPKLRSLPVSLRGLKVGVLVPRTFFHEKLAQLKNTVSDANQATFVASVLAATAATALGLNVTNEGDDLVTRGAGTARFSFGVCWYLTIAFALTSMYLGSCFASLSARIVDEFGWTEGHLAFHWINGSPEWCMRLAVMFAAAGLVCTVQLNFVKDNDKNEWFVFGPMVILVVWCFFYHVKTEFFYESVPRDLQRLEEERAVYQKNAEEPWKPRI